jgi:hypothetical protein
MPEHGRQVNLARAAFAERRVERQPARRAVSFGNRDDRRAAFAACVSSLLLDYGAAVFEKHWTASRFRRR